MYKYHPQWIHTLNLIKTKQLGQVKFIHTTFAYNNTNPKNIRNIKEYGGGALMDIGCYAVSVSRYILQAEPSRVISIMQQHESFKTDYITTGILDFKGIHSVFTVSTSTQPNQSVEIIATAGTIKIHIPFNAYADIKATITVTTPQGTRNIEFDTSDQYELMFKDFCDRILMKDFRNDNFEDAINNMNVIDGLVNSNQKGIWEKI